uniref:C1q and TNF related 1 n=1 Tax=Anas zonorhyncha TaxID=75864 RepID=A0A8B9ZXV0_9AVES
MCPVPPSTPLSRAPVLPGAGGAARGLPSTGGTRGSPGPGQGSAGPRTLRDGAGGWASTGRPRSRAEPQPLGTLPLKSGVLLPHQPRPRPYSPVPGLTAPSLPSQPPPCPQAHVPLAAGPGAHTRCCAGLHLAGGGLLAVFIPLLLLRSPPFASQKVSARPGEARRLPEAGSAAAAGSAPRLGAGGAAAGRCCRAGEAAPGQSSPRGEKGDRGERGMQGKYGKMGVAGSRGHTGPKGQKGSVGAPGERCKSHYAAFSVGRKKPLHSNDYYQTLIFDTEFVNLYEHFNMFTGKFYCYVPGIYYFSLNVHTWNQKETYLHIMRNGAEVVILYAQVSDRSIMQSQSVMLELQEQDEVWVRLYKGERENAVFSDEYDTYITFSGHLIKYSGDP